MKGMSMRITGVLLKYSSAVAWCFFLSLTPVGVYQSMAAPLDEFRGQALELVNESRREHGLDPLQEDSALTEAAQRHAEDMMREGYFSHISPTGETVRGRYLKSGGSDGQYVAENIAQCSNCRPDRQQIRLLHEGWMKSPTHRANILAQGLESFGFGLAVHGSRNYAVQTFAGPGTAPGAENADEAGPLDAEGQLALAVDLINRERQSAGADPLQGSEALSRALATKAGQVNLQKGLPPIELFVDRMRADELAEFARMTLIAVQCGGCGSQPTGADIRFFVGQWLNNPQYRTLLLGPRHTHFGIAVKADGKGRKVALGLVAGR